MSDSTATLAPKTTRKPKAAKAAKGLPVVSLALAIDHQVYQVEPIPSGEFGTKAFRLVKKSADGAVYDVIRDHDGLVVCDCPSYEVTHKGTCSCCKHGAALVTLGLLDAPKYERRIEPADVAPPEPVAQPDDSPAANPEPAPCSACPAAPEPAPAPEPEPDPLAEWTRPVRKTFLRVVAPSPRPVRLALPDGQYDLASLVSGQASLLRGEGSAPFALMAEALDQLARDIKATGANCVAEFTDRLASMEAERDTRLRDEGFAAGFECGAESVTSC